MSRRRRTGRGWSDEDKIKYMRMLAIPLVVVVVLVIIILVMDKKPKETDATVSGTDNTVEIVVEQSGTTAEMSVEPDNSEYKTDFSDYELKKDEVPEVNQLISEYFQAKVDRDAQKLYSLFGKTDEENLDQRQKQLDAEAAEIEDYQEITCYTKQGLTEDSYVVYVTYKIKFRRADSLAPGLLWCYVVKSEDGQYRIRENVVGEEADYVAKANQSEDVRLLASQINQQLKEALESDALLAGAYKKLQKGAVVDSSQPEETKDSNVSIIPGGQETTAADGTETAGTTQEGAPQGGDAGQEQGQESSDSAGDSSAASQNETGAGESSSASQVKIGE